MLEAQIDLRKKGSKAKAAVCRSFFKTGPGQYGEGDEFLGVTVPETRAIAEKHAYLPLVDLKRLLDSPIHEDRLLALVILGDRFEKTKDEALVRFYLKNRARVNNWDLVDTSAYKILGRHCQTIGNADRMRGLLRSKHHWDRRIAIVATFAFIKAKNVSLTHEFAEALLGDEQDLMHKATGWMLREAGKVDERGLRRFLDKHGKRMPRTMLRYAIEKFPKSERLKILASTRA